ncbi:flippase [Candidatus Uhrbacteria bacterium]|nr:flippase [Candidatus Uhrbacteria bacterium]
MSVARKIAYNTGVQAIGKAGSIVLGLITIGFITRSIGTAGFGAFTTVTAFLQFFGIAVDLGLTITLASLFGNPNTDRKKILGTALGFRLVSGLLFFGAAPIVALFFPYSGEIKIGIAIAALAFLATAFTQMLSALFQANLRMDKIAIAEIASRAALLLGVIISAYLHGGLLGIFIALVAANVLNALLALLFANSFTPVRFSFDTREWMELLRRSWPVAVSIALNLVYLRADVLVLSLSRTVEEVGLYGAAYRVVDVLTAFPVLFMGLILPLLSGAWATGDKEKFARLYQKSFYALVILALPLVAGTLALGDKVMSILAGEEFASSGSILRVLILAVFFLFIGALPLHTVVAIEKQKRILWAFAASAVLSLALYALLIPRYGVFAAAGITLFSEAFVAVSAGILVKKETGVGFGIISAWRAALSAIIMGAAGYFMRDLHAIAAVTLSALIYFALLLATGAVTPNTLTELLKLRAKKPINP